MSTSGCAALTLSPCGTVAKYASYSASMSTTACACRLTCRPVAVHRSLCRLALLSKPQLESQEACRPVLPQVRQRVDHWLRIAQCVPYRLCLHFCLRVTHSVDHFLLKSATVSTSGYAYLSVSPTVSASTSTCDSASVSTTACASRPACRPVDAHRSQCRLASLLHLCLRVSHRFDQCLRKSGCVWTIACASFTVSHSVSSSTSACDSTSVLTTACPSRPACRPVAAHISVCHLTSLPPPLLATQPACGPAVAQVGQRVDHCLCIA